MESKRELFVLEEPFRLESGAILPRLEIAYHSYGTLSAERDNVVWIYHALTANSDPATWWPDVVGEGKALDPSRHFIICGNILGSCYGSSGPLSINPGTGDFWYSRFPEVTIRDSVRAFSLLRDSLGIERVKLGVGASLGGQQCLEAAIREQDVFENLVLIATNAAHSPWGIAWNAAQRMAIQADPTWNNDSPQAGQKGLAAARAQAMLSYRSYETYRHTQSEKDDQKHNDFLADSYQRYQGEKLVKRFNAHSYLLLSRAMDSHNIGRGRESKEHALQRILARTLVVGISSDLLFPVHEQRFLASRIPNARYREITSPFGHDGFLIEGEKIARIIRQELKETEHESATYHYA